jgi:hypothetical protein
MMKTIVTAALALVVCGCSISTTRVSPEVHSETQHHIDVNTASFIQLVNTIRLNSNVRNPSVGLKNQINNLAFNAGLIPQCDDKYGCYLIRPGFEGKIRIDREFVIIDTQDKHMKFENVNLAAMTIYG